MAASTTVTVFVCKRLGDAQLMRSGCASRYDACNGGEQKRGAIKLEERACVKCPVGKAHSDGERPTHWPEGDPIRFFDKLVPKQVDLGPPKVTPRVPTMPVIKGPAPMLPDRRADPVAARDVEDVAEAPTARHRALPPAPPASPRPDSSDAVAAPVEPGGGSEVKPLNLRLVTLDDVTLTVAEWCKISGIDVANVRSRMHIGWTIEDAVMAPKGAPRPKRPGTTPGADVAPAAGPGDATPAPSLVNATGAPVNETPESVNAPPAGIPVTVAKPGELANATLRHIAPGVGSLELLEEPIRVPTMDRQVGVEVDARTDARDVTKAATDIARDVRAEDAISFVAQLLGAPMRPAELLRALGYDARELGRSPAGHVIVVAPAVGDAARASST